MLHKQANNPKTMPQLFLEEKTYKQQTNINKLFIHIILLLKHTHTGAYKM